MSSVLRFEQVETSQEEAGGGSGPSIPQGPPAQGRPRRPLEAQGRRIHGKPTACGQEASAAVWVEGGSEAQAREARGHREGRRCRPPRTQRVPPASSVPTRAGTPHPVAHTGGDALSPVPTAQADDSAVL